MSDPAIAGYGVVDGPPLPLSPNNTVIANLSGAAGYPTAVTLAALSAALSTVAYQGTWNASTNTPALASGVGTGGQYYIVSVAGTTNLDGITDWSVGDWAIFNATTVTWQKIEAGTTALTAGSTLVGGGTANGLLWRNAGVLAVGAATLVGGTALAGLTTLAVAGALATGTVLTALGGVNIGASASAAAWTTSGIGLVQNAASYTDTSSSGTVAAAYTNLFGASTVLASSATTYTSYYGTYFKAPIASTNVTFTSKSALGADTVSIGGAAQSTDALAVTGTSTFSSTIKVTNGAVNAPAGPMVLQSGGTAYLGVGTGSVGGAVVKAASYFAFTNDATVTGTLDTVISRPSAGVVQIGTSGSSINASGELRALNISLGNTGVLKMGNTLVTGLTPATVVTLLTKSIILYDTAGTPITVYGS